MSRAPTLDPHPEADPASRRARPPEPTGAAALYELLLTKRGRRRGLPPGEDAAGRVLAVVLLALVLAALINADALVERAEEKPFGPGRDRSLAIWHPVQDVAHVLQLHRIRELGDRLVGDEGDRGASSAAPPATTTTAPPDDGAASTTTTQPTRPVLRAPTVGEPLRIWVGGDSMMRDLSESVLRLAADDPLLAVTAHYEISSGLTRPDYYDWPSALAADMESTAAEVAVVMFGANDGQGIVEPDGTVHQSVTDPGWAQEYRRRVDAVMDQLRADGRLVLWVLQPPMRDGGFDARIRVINDVYRAAAADRPWVQLVETAPVVGTADGGYDPSLRQGDGIHLDRDGADRLAQHLVDLIRAEFPTSSATTTTTPPDADG